MCLGGALRAGYDDSWACFEFRLLALGHRGADVLERIGSFGGDSRHAWRCHGHRRKMLCADPPVGLCFCYADLCRPPLSHLALRHQFAETLPRHLGQWLWGGGHPSCTSEATESRPKTLGSGGWVGRGGVWNGHGITSYSGTDVQLCSSGSVAFAATLGVLGVAMVDVGKCCADPLVGLCFLLRRPMQTPALPTLLFVTSLPRHYRVIWFWVGSHPSCGV